jgi:transposase InsO family protein
MESADWGMRRSNERPIQNDIQKKFPGTMYNLMLSSCFSRINKVKRIKRFQYTAIDDATRIRALNVYSRHTQANAMDFLDYVVEKFPFRIKTIRTDRGHEFQARFHWYVEDSGMEHVYIKPMTPQLNGKVERSHRTDKDEYYQLLSYTDDVDLNEKLQAWESYYNLDRPHFSHQGKTPYEVMKLLLEKAR